MLTLPQRRCSPCSSEHDMEHGPLSVCPPAEPRLLRRHNIRNGTRLSLVRAATDASKLALLPSELIQLILAHLHTSALKRVALVCQTLYRHATDILWQNVCLADQRKRHGSIYDEHDDTPIIEKLYILATYARPLSCSNPP